MSAATVPTLITAAALCEMLGITRAGLPTMLERGALPQPIKLGAARSAPLRWVLAEVIEALDRQRLPAPATKSRVEPAPEPASRRPKKVKLTPPRKRVA